MKIVEVHEHDKPNKPAIVMDRAYLYIWNFDLCAFWRRSSFQQPCQSLYVFFGCLVVVVVGFSIKKNPPFPGIVCKNRLPFNLFWKHIFILIFLLHVLILLPTFCFANLNFKEWEIETVKSLGEIYWPNATLYHGYIYFVDSVNAWSTFYVKSWLFNCR